MLYQTFKTFRLYKIITNFSNPQPQNQHPIPTKIPLLIKKMIYQHSKHYNTKIMLQSNPIHKQSYKLHQYSFITLNFDSFFHPITNLSLAINWILYINIKIIAETITNFSKYKTQTPNPKQKQIVLLIKMLYINIPNTTTIKYYFQSPSNTQTNLPLHR